jgi:hypothetical protein
VNGHQNRCHAARSTLCGSTRISSFDVIRRCAGEQNSDPLCDFAQIVVLVGQHDNELGVEFRTDLIGHALFPKKFHGPAAARALNLVAEWPQSPVIRQG